MRKGQGRIFVCCIFTALLGVSVTTPQLSHAQGLVENPHNGSKVSGISVISGWKCTAGTITVQIDNEAPLVASYGTLRTDTQEVCGDTNNGFGLLWNWNKYADGTHTLKVFDNGVQFDAATFTIATLGTEFLQGAEGAAFATGFPQANTTTVLEWQESQQNFVITDTLPDPNFPSLFGHYQVSFTETHTGCSNPINNGTSFLTGQLTVANQKGSLFQGTAYVPNGSFFSTTAIGGTVSPSGELRGFVNADLYAAPGVYLASGAGDFTGTFSGNTFSGTYQGRLVLGETCTVSGSLSGVR